MSKTLVPGVLSVIEISLIYKGETNLQIPTKQVESSFDISIRLFKPQKAKTIVNNFSMIVVLTVLCKTTKCSRQKTLIVSIRLVDLGISSFQVASKFNRRLCQPLNYGYTSLLIFFNIDHFEQLENFINLIGQNGKGCCSDF